MFDRTPVTPDQPAAAAFTLTIEITNNHVYVPVRAGERDLWFLLDTGAGATLLNQRLAAELELATTATFEVRGVGAGALTGAMLAAPLPVWPGDHAALELPVPAMMPLEHLEPIEGRRIDGILGYDFISRHVLRLDYAARRMSVHEPGAFEYGGSGAMVPITIRHGHPHVSAAVEIAAGRWATGDFVIDIGSAMPLTLTKRFADANGGRELLDQAFTADAGRGVGGPTRMTVGRVRSLRLGTIEWSYPVACVFGDGAGVMSSGEFFEANIGGGLLREYALILDYPRSRLILER